MAPVTFKITFGRTVRRFEAEGRIGWQELVGKVQDLFSLPKESANTIRLSYIDEDGDLVILDSDQEMQAILSDAVRQGAQVIRFHLQNTVSSQETDNQIPDGATWVFAEESNTSDATQPEKTGNPASTIEPYSLTKDNEESTLGGHSADNNSKPEIAHQDQALSVEISLVTSDDESEGDLLEAEPELGHEEAHTEKNAPEQDATAEGENTDGDSDEDNDIYLAIYLIQDLSNLFRRRHCGRPFAAPGFSAGCLGGGPPFFRPQFNPYGLFGHPGPFSHPGPFGHPGSFGHPGPFGHPGASHASNCTCTCAQNAFNTPAFRVSVQTPQCQRAEANASHCTPPNQNTCQRGQRKACGNRAGCAKKFNQPTADGAPAPSGCPRRNWRASCSANADSNPTRPTRCHRGRKQTGFFGFPESIIDASYSIAGPSGTHTDQPQPQNSEAFLQQGWRAFLTDQLAILKQMGFEDEVLNRKLLERYEGSIVRVIDAQTRGKDAEEPVKEGNQMSED